jgi:tetratricopeptide (TPR) repeat protein
MKIDLALKDLHYALSLNENGDVCGLLSVCYNLRFDYDTSMMYAKKGILLDPNSGFCQLGIGWSLWGKHDYKTALANLTKAIKSETLPGLSLLKRGQCYFMLEDLLHAETDLRKAIKYGEGRHILEEAYLFLGYILQKKKNLKEACECWRKAFQIRKEPDIKDEINRYCKQYPGS